MSLETAKKAVSLFVKGNNGDFLIRLLGGEPLLNFPAAKGIVDFGLKNYSKVRFDLTTNGLLLDKKIIDFFLGQKHVELILSSYQTDMSRLKTLFSGFGDLSQVTINFNLLPQTIEASLQIFKNLIGLGFRRFNFLPAFYLLWQEEEIAGLEKVLREISLLIKSFASEIIIKNLEYFSPVPLYNLAPAIDCQGDIFAGDFFLDSRFKPLKNILNLGNIYKLRNSYEIFDLPLHLNVDLLLSQVFSPSILEINTVINKKLADFCNQFRFE